MAKYGIFPISKFAKLSRTTRDALHHYDKIGLLSPIARGENNYRYYSSDQLAIVNVIRVLQESGLSLAEIKDLRDRRTPARALDMLARQIGWIDAKIDELIVTRKLFQTLWKGISSAATVDETGIAVRYLPEEAMILGDINDYGGGRNEYDALLAFYRSIEARYLNVDLNYPVWAFYSGDRVRRGEWTRPERYYFINPEGQDRRPAGRYAIGYARGGYGGGDALYRRLTDYIDAHHLEICGGAYEEYPLGDVCVPDEDNYLMRVMIAVRDPERSPAENGGARAAPALET